MKQYVCDIKNTNGESNYLIHDEEGRIFVLIYAFYDKEEYLMFKEILEKGELIETSYPPHSFSLQYLLDGFPYLLQTSTINDSNTYRISLTNYK